MLTEWRGKALDAKASQDILIGHFFGGGDEEEKEKDRGGQQLLPWSWKVGESCHGSSLFFMCTPHPLLTPHLHLCSLFIVSLSHPPSSFSLSLNPDRWCVVPTQLTTLSQPSTRPSTPRKRTQTTSGEVSTLVA